MGYVGGAELGQAGLSGRRGGGVGQTHRLLLICTISLYIVPRRTGDPDRAHLPLGIERLLRPDSALLVPLKQRLPLLPVQIPARPHLLPQIDPDLQRQPANRESAHHNREMPLDELPLTHLRITLQ